MMRTLICLSLLCLSACNAPATPNASASPGSSPNPAATPAPGSSAVTANRAAYSAYLGCLNDKHPGKGYASIKALVDTGIYDANWAAYKPQADNSVKINSDAYGKECGA